MKKRFLASLLALGMLLTMVTGAAWAADGDGANEAKIGSTEYLTLQEAIQAAQAGGTITLLKDVSAQDGATWENVNIDLAGHTITVPQEASLTIQSGTFTSTGNELLKVEGTAMINGGEFSSTQTADQTNKMDGKGIIAVDGGRLTMEGGTIDAERTSGAAGYALHGLTLFNGANVTLGEAGTPGPTIKGNYTAIGMNNLKAGNGLTLTINSGTYSTSNALGNEKFNAIIYLSAQINATINGGTFTATATDIASDGGAYVFSIPYNNVAVSLDVTGGTFNSTASTIFRTKAQTLAQVNSGTPTAEISGGTFTEKAPATAGEYSFKPYVDSQYEINANGEIVEKDTTPVAAGGLNVTATKLSTPTEGKVKVEVALQENVSGTLSDNLYYYADTAQMQAPNVGDEATAISSSTDITLQGKTWKKLPAGTDKTLENIADGNLIAVVELDADKKVVRWGRSNATDDGVEETNPPENATGLTVSATKTDTEATLTITGKGTGNLYYKFGAESDLTAPKVDSAFTTEGWKLVPSGDKVTLTEAEKTATHVAVVEVTTDNKVAKWGKGAVSSATPPTTDPKPAEGLSVTAKKDSDGKITVTVTGETSGNKLHYLFGDSSLAALKVGEELPGAWKELKDKTFTPDSADKNKTYIAIAETKDGKVTKWGKGEIKAASTPSDGSNPDKLTLSPVSGGLGKKVSVEIGGGHWLTIRVEKGTSVALSSIQAPSGSGKTKVTFSAPSGSKVKVWETEKEITFGSNGSVSADIIAVGEITL